jgi:RNA polymerase sigma-70 factor (ECF subfamily)
LCRAKQHDQEAWRRLVRLYGPLVGYWVEQAGLRAFDAADVLQEVFQAVAQGIGGLRNDQPGDSFRGWLHGITRFKLADHFRRQGTEPPGVGGSAAAYRLEQVPGLQDDSSADGGALRQLRIRAFELVQAEFEPRTWQMFWTVAAEGQTTQEVATRFGVTVSAVRVAKSRVMRRLRQELGDLLEKPEL